MLVTIVVRGLQFTAANNTATISEDIRVGPWALADMGEYHDFVCEMLTQGHKEKVKRALLQRTRKPFIPEKHLAALKERVRTIKAAHRAAFFGRHKPCPAQAYLP